jgi:hypothetical protein
LIGNAVEPLPTVKIAAISLGAKRRPLEALVGPPAFPTPKEGM